MILSNKNCERLLAVLHSTPYIVHAHNLRVGLYMQILSSDMTIDTNLRLESGDDLARELGYYHDIGKAALPLDLFKKTDDLTEEDKEIFKTHTTMSKIILEDTVTCSDEFERQNLNLIVQTATSHHENWDGSGYPEGLSGEGIPIWSRICSIANDYDNMRKADAYISHKRIVESIESKVGSKYDPEVFNSLIRHDKEIRTLK